MLLIFLSLILLIFVSNSTIHGRIDQVNQLLELDRKSQSTDRYGFTAVNHRDVIRIINICQSSLASSSSIIIKSLLMIIFTDLRV